MRTVITGVGIVSPVATGRDAFGAALAAGRPAFGPITAFEAADSTGAVAAQVTLDPASLLGSKGLRYMSRSTHWLQCATHLALLDAALGDQAERDRWMLAVGTAFGSLDAISRFDHEALRNGPSSVNPMAFPNTVVNAPAGQTAIRFGLRGPNITLSAAAVSGLAAIGYAMTAVADGRVPCALAGGAEELSEAAWRGFGGGRPVGVADPPPLRLGEGAALLVLEPAAGAAARGAVVLGVAAGYGEAFGDHGAAAAIRQALDDAGRTADGVDLIATATGGDPVADDQERAGRDAIFGVGPAAPPVFGVKALCGEALGASGGFQAAAALHALAAGVLPGGVPAPNGRRISCVLVTASNADGQHAALVLEAADRSAD